jgi:CGNR zinc finger
MQRLPAVRLDWLVDLVNEYGTQPRAVAGEAGQSFPGLIDAPSSAADLGSEELTALADRCWPVFAEPAPTLRAGLLNDELAAARLSPVTSAGGDLEWLTGHVSSLQVLAAGCACALLTAVTRFGWDRLGICAGVDCADVYIDQRGRTRRLYCSPTCLNRARVRAYRARH